MFTTACALAQNFTRPVVLSRRNRDGSCGSGIGAFVVVNRDGWAVTAFHVIQQADQAAREGNEVQRVEREIAAIRADATLSKKDRGARLRALPTFGPKAATNTSTWWSWDGMDTHPEIVAIPAVDLAIFRLRNFDAASVRTYPTFKRPDLANAPGTSLCRTGFPFHSITPTFDPATGFRLPPASMPIPFFPNDGIMTRVVEVIPDPPLNPAPAFRFRFIETSSPGLRGQSGGPLFDRTGNVWGIQSQTRHMPLGFSPEVPNGRPGEKEHQFMNVGWCIHVETVVGALRDHGVDFAISAD